MRGARVAGTTNQAGSTTIAAIAFSEEETGELRAWDLSTGEVVAQHRSSAASFVAITALQTPDGPLVAVGDFSGRVGFLSLEGPVHWPERRHDMPVAGLVAGVVGDRPLVTSTDVFGGIVVWDPVTRLPLDLRVPLSRRGSPPVSIADIHGVPRLLIGGTIGFRCANLVDATVDDRSAGGPRLLTALATVRDRGRDFALVGGGNQLQLFDLEVADPAPAEQVLTPYTGLATTQVAGQPLVITVDQDSQVRVVDAATGARTAVSTGQEADWAAAVDGTSWVALGSFREPRGTGVSLVDLATGRSRAVPRSNPDRPVSALAAAAIGQNVVVATGNRAGQVEVWFSHEDGVHLYSPHQEELTTSTLVFATLSGLLVLVSGNADGTIAVMDVASRRLLGRRAAHRDVVSALAVSGEVIISGSYSGEIRSWQGPGLEPGSQVTQAHGGKVNSLTVPPARWAQVVSSGDDAVLRSWSLEDLSPISSTVPPAPNAAGNPSWCASPPQPVSPALSVHNAHDRPAPAGS